MSAKHRGVTVGEFKRPESALVVVHTPRLQCLLLERVTPRGFWQSVTGTLRWGEELTAAAVREMREETGVVCVAPAPVTAGVPGSRAEGIRERQPRSHANAVHEQPPPMLMQTNVSNRFPILPEWRHRYAPGVTENLEHLLYLELPETCEVTLNAAEHVTYRWMGLEEAIRKVTSWTNREALERLRTAAGHRR